MMWTYQPNKPFPPQVILVVSLHHKSSNSNEDSELSISKLLFEYAIVILQLSTGYLTFLFVSILCFIPTYLGLHVKHHHPLFVAGIHSIMTDLLLEPQNENLACVFCFPEKNKREIGSRPFSLWPRSRTKQKPICKFYSVP